MPANAPVYAAIRATNARDPVQIVRHGKSIRIKTLAGVPIGCLSEAGRKVWEPHLEFIQTAKVTATVRRTKDQESEEYRDRAVVDSWEFPIIVLVPAGVSASVRLATINNYRPSLSSNIKSNDEF